MRIVEDDTFSVALPAEVPTRVVDGTIAGFSCYRTVEETYASAQAIVDTHPQLAAWTTAGESWKKEQNASDGYDLKVLRLTNSATSGAKPALFITTALHPREYATAELSLRFAERLADAYETDADVRWLLDHQKVDIMLQANPDGRKRAEEGTAVAEEPQHDPLFGLCAGRRSESQLPLQMGRLRLQHHRVQRGLSRNCGGLRTGDTGSRGIHGRPVPGRPGARGR